MSAVPFGQAISGFDWDHDVNLPFTGRSPAAKHAGSTGALAAAHVFGVHQRDYLCCLYGFGELGRNDFDAATQIGVFRTSINSLRDSSMRAGLVEETKQYDTAIFGTRQTKRQRYRLTAQGRAWVEAWRRR